VLTLFYPVYVFIVTVKPIFAICLHSSILSCFWKKLKEKLLYATFNSIAKERILNYEPWTLNDLSFLNGLLFFPFMDVFLFVVVVFQCFNRVPLHHWAALERQQLHLAPVHQEGEDKPKSPVKIGIHQAVVSVAFLCKLSTIKNT